MGFVESLALSLGIQALAMIVPGQNHLLLLSMAHERGRVRLGAAVGIATAGLVFSTGAAASLWLGGRAASTAFFGVLNIVGAAYLLYLGVRFLIAVARREPAVGVAAGSAEVRTIGGAFTAGFLVNLSNPKSALFFASVFATTLPLSDMSFGAFGFVVAAFFGNSLVVHGVVAVLFSVAAVRRFVAARERVIRLVAGVVFVLFGLGSATLTARRLL